MQKDNRYFLVTPPMEFIRDILDIMSDGDNLTPERLVADVVDLLKNYTSQHNQSLESTKRVLEEVKATQGDEN